MNSESKPDEAICGKQQVMAAVEALNAEIRGGARIMDQGDYIARHIQSQNMVAEVAAAADKDR